MVGNGLEQSYGQIRLLYPPKEDTRAAISIVYFSFLILPQTPCSQPSNHVAALDFLPPNFAPIYPHWD